MNHIIKLALLATAGTLAVVSAYLTANFLSTTGEAVGLGNVFAIAGVALDIIKTIAPMAVLIAWKNGKHNVAIAGGVLAIALTALSIQASYQSIDRSVTSMAMAANQSNQESKLIQSSLESNRRVLASVLEQQAVFTKAGMATKAGELNERIDKLNADIEVQSQKLINIKNQFEPTLPATGIMIISVAIEAASIIGLMMVDSVKTKTNSMLEPVTVQATFATSQTTSETTSTTTTASVTTSTYELAKEMVIARRIKPSERGLQKSMNITRNEASILLTQMEMDGVLVRDGRYRKLNELLLNE